MMWSSSANDGGSETRDSTTTTNAKSKGRSLALGQLEGKLCGIKRDCDDDDAAAAAAVARG
jgi:hypothetical protein